MELYYSPLACSLASRISLYEAGVDATYIEVDPRTKQLPDGRDYRELYVLGLVPALRTDDGSLLTENIAVLQHIAGLSPALRVTPAQTSEVLRWLAFISSELHKGLFNPLFVPGVPDAARSYAIEKGASRLAYLDSHMEGREYVVDRFSVADAYLYTALTWTAVTPVSLDDYPALHGYHRRLRERPSVARAFTEELGRYQAQQARSAG